MGAIVLVAVALLFNPLLNGKTTEKVQAVVYKSLSCGCCGLYGDYFKKQGNFNTQIINSEDMDSIKNKYNIPRSLQSCHTTIIGDYFVEGHIPLEAVEKLLKEKPNIAGIAMSGMPAGSPGMPGKKTKEFVIYGVEKNGNTYEFMKI